jgi:hypothetical protein
MQLPSPRFRQAPLPKELCSVRGFHSLQTFFPTLSSLYNLKGKHKESVWLDSKWRIRGIDISGTSGPCFLKLVPNVDVSGDMSPSETRSQSAYMKVTHLLDPIRWMKGKYSLPKQNGLPWDTQTWAPAWTKLQDSWNQAYVEAVASYALGRLRDEGISPHFNEFYGAFCARADIYRYNLTEEIGEYRTSPWFWRGQKNSLFKLCILDRVHPGADVPEDIMDEYLREPSVLDSDSDSDSGSEAGDISVDLDSDDDEVIDVKISDDMASLHSDGMSDISFTENNQRSESESSDASSEEVDDTYKIYAELNDFPVMLIAIEQNSGTMDELLDSIELVGAKHGTPEWEIRWSAWLFQVIAALTVAQAMFGFTHNDLHTNNIVWIPTSEEFLYYTLKSGATFKVPTFGKLFRIIDYGRSIFTINGTQFISDDFRDGNDAGGQYAFEPLTEGADPEIPPNPSFDLCRLSVSLFEALFPEEPENCESKEVLSSEEGLTVLKSVSPLYNCLWSWMVDDNGENVLVNADGSERFPNFDLYNHIATSIHNAIPSQQFTHPAFDQFQVNPSEVGDVKKWQLFI